ncbi:nucleotidyltransferase domain-containing protein [Halostagnicola bangensis]
MNSTPSANHQVEEVVTQVVEEYPVELAVLFGSYARGTETPESDIDVAVAFDGDRSPQERLELRIDLVVELTKALEMDAVDVADFESIRPGIGIAALQTGTVLVGENDQVQHLLGDLEQEVTTDGETHEDRMRRFDSILEQLEANVA